MTLSAGSRERRVPVPRGTGAAGFAKPGEFVLESMPMSHRFYAYFFFFSRLAAEGTG